MFWYICRKYLKHQPGKSDIMQTKNDNSKLIAVFKGNPLDAEMIKNMLIEAGISASLKNQHMGTIAPWQVSAGGFEPVDVLVFESDKEKALVLIEALSNNHSKD